MLKEEIQSYSSKLAELLPRVSPDVAAELRIVRRNLAASADYAGELESKLYVPLPTARAGHPVPVCPPLAPLDRERLLRGQVRRAANQ